MISTFFIDALYQYLEGQEGLEPSTPCLRGRCSNQLSYWPSSALTPLPRFAYSAKASVYGYEPLLKF